MTSTDTGSKFESSNSGPNALCAKCLALGHSSRSCTSTWCCKACFNNGHQARWCFTKARPKVLWAPKVRVRAIPPELTLCNPSPKNTLLDHSTPASENQPFPSGSSSPPNYSAPRSSPAAPPPPPPPIPSMANFPCNPMLLVLASLHVEHGWQRPARARVALGAEPPRRHEQYAIISLQPEPAIVQVEDLLQEVVIFLQENFLVRVISAFPSVLGLGLF